MEIASGSPAFQRRKMFKKDLSECLTGLLLLVIGMLTLLVRFALIIFYCVAFYFIIHVYGDRLIVIPRNIIASIYEGDDSIAIIGAFILCLVMISGVGLFGAAMVRCAKGLLSKIISRSGKK